MKAAAYTRYGGPEVVQIEEVAAPVPRQREVLIQVRATTVSSGDARLRPMRLPRGMGLLGRLAFGLAGPRKRVLGSELTGVVTAIGEGVTRFAPGDAVIGFPGVRMGAHAEFCIMREDAALIHRHANLSDAQAAAFGGRNRRSQGCCRLCAAAATRARCREENRTALTQSLIPNPPSPSIPNQVQGNLDETLHHRLSLLRRFGRAFGACPSACSGQHRQRGDRALHRSCIWRRFWKPRD